MSVSSNLTFFRGEDITLTFTMTPPTDITGWTTTFTVRNTLGGTSQFTRTPTITDAKRGVFTVAILKANTTSLAVGRYVWDVRRTDAGSNTTLAEGYIFLKQEITA